MKKTSLGLFVILFALMATVLCTSCKKDEPDIEIDLTTINFCDNAHFWVLTDFFCEDVDGQDAQTIEQALPNNAGIDFQSERAMYVYTPLNKKPYPLILEWNIKWTSMTKTLVITTNTDEYTGKVVLTEDKEKVLFDYVGKPFRGSKNFTMKGYKLKKDFK